MVVEWRSWPAIVRPEMVVQMRMALRIVGPRRLNDPPLPRVFGQILVKIAKGLLEIYLYDS